MSNKSIVPLPDRCVVGEHGHVLVGPPGVKVSKHFYPALTRTANKLERLSLVSFFVSKFSSLPEREAPDLGRLLASPINN